MKAAVYTKYGPPSVVRIQEIDTLTPKNNEVLVRIRASSVNRTDCGFLRARPSVVRLFSGLTKPKRTVLGCEYAGEIAAVGDKVSLYKVGDKVFGFNDVKFGGHGEFAVFTEDDPMAIMPRGKSFTEMAASTEGSHYALSYVRALKVRTGHRILVNGATGAIGSAAVQLLKYAGADVVATSDTKNLKLIQSLGPDKVIDREKEDFTKINEQFDAVFDSVGKSSFRACKPILKPGGIYVSTELGYMVQNPLLALMSPLFRLFRMKRVIFPIPKNNKEIIEFLGQRVEQGDFTPVIDRTYPLEQIVEAYEYVETGHKTGNVVIRHG